MHYYICQNEEGHTIVLQENNLYTAYKTKHMDARRVPYSLENKVLSASELHLLQIHATLPPTVGWLPGVVYPDVYVDETRIEITEEIRLILSRVKDVFGYFIITGTGYKWKIGQVVQGNVTMYKYLLADAIYAYYFITGSKLDFVRQAKNWTDPYVKGISTAIINANKEALESEINNALNCLEIIVPSKINKLEMGGVQNKFVYLSE